MDLDWDDPNARSKGLQQLLAQVRSLGAWLERELKEQAQEPPLREQWDLVQRLIAQDTEPDPGPQGDGRRITQGVAKDRRISISDPDMRHGRKTKRKRIDGYKRHIAVDLDTPGLVCAVALTPANQPERAAAKALLQDISRTHPALKDLYIDRGYLGDETIEAQRAKGLRVHCRPYPLRNGERFDKGAFEIDLEAQSVRCPDGAVVPLKRGAVLHFPAERCSSCPRRALCTRAQNGRGRSLSIHPQEPFHLDLRRRAKTPEGCQDLRERIAVEHALAALHNRQGNRARYRSLRKNLFDLRRHAALKNLSVVDRLRHAA
ncbi:MAG: transposase [Proteobacteria bacterium]|nr:transposase [Pseudomonadota bacterium]